MLLISATWSNNFFSSFSCNKKCSPLAYAFQVIIISDYLNTLKVTDSVSHFQAFQIANLVKEYTEVLQGAPKEVKKRENKRNGSARPVSILHKPVPVIESTS